MRAEVLSLFALFLLSHVQDRVEHTASNLVHPSLPELQTVDHPCLIA